MRYESLKGEKIPNPDFQFLGAKEAYDDIITRFKKQKPLADDLFENLLQERAFELDKVGEIIFNYCSLICH